MKKAKEIETIVDLSKVISNIVIDDNDCLGREWSLTSNICQNCAEYNLCASLFLSNIVNKETTKISEIHAPFLDENLFDDIDRKAMYESIETGKTTTQEVFDEIRLMSNCKSDYIVLEWLKVFKLEYNLKSIKGVFHK